MKNKKKVEKRSLVVLGMILTRKGGKMKDKREKRNDWRKEMSLD
jgi:hypothetical protein